MPVGILYWHGCYMKYTNECVFSRRFLNVTFPCCTMVTWDGVPKAAGAIVVGYPFSLSPMESWWKTTPFMKGKESYWRHPFKKLNHDYGRKGKNRYTSNGFEVQDDTIYPGWRAAISSKICSQRRCSRKTSGKPSQKRRMEVFRTTFLLTETYVHWISLS